MKTKEDFDTIIVGGGPAGIMAAIKASEKNKVALIEKNSFLGKKLLITGNGRCNISQAEFNNKKFVKKLSPKGDFLLSALSIFNSKDIVEFFENSGLKTKIERGGRIFPISDRSQDVQRILLKQLNKNKVKLFLNEKVIGFNVKEKIIKNIILKDKKLTANNFILATGGKSYPGTGSTGNGYLWAKKMGHTIIEPKPALVPIRSKEDWPKKIAGLSLKNVQVSLFQDNKKIETIFGEMLFTHFGLSGPIILNLSQKIGEIINQGEIKLEINLKPALDFSTLDKRLQRDFKSNKSFKNYLPNLLPKKLGEIIIKNSQIDPDKKLNLITKEERKKLVHCLFSLPITIKSLLGFNYAIITSGGVDLKEIDSKTMKSKIIKNLSFAGEIINLDGPTGGYNLQICWSTGYIAGINT